MKRGWHIPSIFKHNLKWRKGFTLMLIGSIYIIFSTKLKELLIPVTIAAALISVSDLLLSKSSIFAELSFKSKLEKKYYKRDLQMTRKLEEVSYEYSKRAKMNMLLGKVLFLFGFLAPFIFWFIKPLIPGELLTNLSDIATFIGLGVPLFVIGLKDYLPERMKHLDKILIETRNNNSKDRKLK